MRFREGDIVRISSQASATTPIAPQNPRNTNGKVTRTYNSIITIQWDNRESVTSGYMEHDLKLYRRVS